MRVPLILLLVLMGLTPLIIFASLVVLPGQIKWQPPQNWRVEFGTPGYRNEITALSGNASEIYAGGHVGYSLGPCVATPCDVFLKKFSSSGTEVWSRQLGTPDNLTIDQIDIGVDGVYIAGYESANATGYAEKIDLNGGPVWKTNLGTNYVPTGLGSTGSWLYSTGLIVGNSNGLTTLVLKKIELNGNLLWTRTLVNQTTLGVARIYDSMEGVYVAASDDPSVANADHGSISRYDFNGTLVWTRALDSPPSVVYGLSGDSSGIYLGGSYLRKYDFGGNILWTTSKLEYDSSVSAGSTGVLLMGANLQMYDPVNGNLAWSFHPPGGDLVLGDGNQVLIAGNAGAAVGTSALLASYALSSSLVIAGINPPYSFLLISGIIGLPVLVILEERRRNRRQRALPRG